jgi:hypothetical protein
MPGLAVFIARNQVATSAAPFGASLVARLYSAAHLLPIWMKVCGAAVEL